MVINACDHGYDCGRGHDHDHDYDYQMYHVPHCDHDQRYDHDSGIVLKIFCNLI